MSTFDPGSIDLTADLTGGNNDAALADVAPQNGAAGGEQPALPPGVQSKIADAKGTEAPKPAAEVKPEPTLRDMLSSAFKPKDGAPAETATNTGPVVAPLTKDNDGKYRTADGTFASTEAIAAFEASNAAKPVITLNADTQQSPVLSGLTPVEQQQFQSLPAELRQYVERTMEGLNTRASAYSEYDLIEREILGPRRAAFASQGANPVTALNQLFALSDFAGRDPGQFVMWFAEQRKLDLDALLDARDAATANVDPVVRELQSQVQQLTGTVQQFQQQGQQSVQQDNYKAVETFATEKDASGALKRPYVTEVTDAWASQIGAIRAANPTMPNAEVLEKAYQAACWSDPTVRGKMQQAEAAARATTDAAKVAAAKRAGGSVSGAPAGEPSTNSNNSNRTIRDELESQFAAARA